MAAKKKKIVVKEGAAKRGPKPKADKAAERNWEAKKLEKENEELPPRTPVIREKAPEIPDVENPKTLNGIINKVNSDFKRKMLMHADEMQNLHYIRRPTGIMQLDIDLGGGFSAGTFNTITGPDNSGKSTLLYKICAMHQKLYGADSHIAFAPVEDGGIDYFRARRMGWIVAVPTGIIEAEQERRYSVGAPLLTAEEVADLRVGIGTNMQIGVGTQEEILDTVEVLLMDNKCGIIWLDSLEALEPNAEAILKSLEDNPQQGAHARNMTRFFQHYGPIRNSQEVLHKTTMVATCQVRANRKKAEVQANIAKYLPDSTGTNVRSIKHWRSSDVVISPGEKIKTTGGEHKGTQEGKYINWEIKKGRDDTHDGIKGDVAFYYDHPTHTKDLEDLVITGMKYGAIREHNGMLTLYRADGKPDQYLNEVPNAHLFSAALSEDFELEYDTRMQILHYAGKRCHYRGP